MENLSNAEFITETKYPTWLTNIFLVRKANNKLYMCIDFTNMNVDYPKDPYPLPNIDRLTDGSLDYHMLTFMDAYLGYN